MKKSKGKRLGWMKESDIKKRKVNPIKNEYKLVK